MYGLSRLNSANHLVAFFAAAAAATAAASYLKRTNKSRNTCKRKRLLPVLVTSVTMLTWAHGVCDVLCNTCKRKTLPPELSKNVAMLTCESAAHGGVCDVYLVGTTHYSPESCRQVQDVIRFLKPQVVFLELCSGRSGYHLTLDKNNGPIGEFQVGYEEAMKYGAKVILGDRLEGITYKRVPVMAVLWEMFSCCFLRTMDTLATLEDITKELVEKNDVDSVNRGLLKIDKMVPTLMEIFVHERDRYMSANLLEVASKHNSVVAVVGRGHLQGIQKNWKQPVDMEQLLQVPIFGGFAGVVLMCSIIHFFG